MRLGPSIRALLESVALLLSYTAVIALLCAIVLPWIIRDRWQSSSACVLGLFVFVAAIICRFTCNVFLDRDDGNRVRRRDLCPNCAYDLSSHARNAQCPECGFGRRRL